MAVPSKDAQVAEARAREQAGVDPASNMEAARGTEHDGSVGDPGNDGTRQQQGDPQPQRAAPPVQSKFDVKRDDILKRFRTGRGEQEAEARDEISDFQRTGMPPEFEPPAEVRTEGDGDHLDPGAANDGSQAASDGDAQAPRFKVKINGVEKEVTLDELTAHAQKSMAAENILDYAKSQAKELETLLGQAREKVARADRPDQHQVRQPNTQQPTEAQAEPGDPEHHEDPLLTLVQNLQFGDPQEASTQLRNTIASQVEAGVQRAREQERLQDEGARAARALNKAKEENPEIATDPMASAAVEAAILNQQVEDIKALGVDLKQLRPDGLDPTPGDIATAHRWYRAKGFQVSSPETMLENGIKKFKEWKGQSNPQPADPAPAPADKTAPRIEISVDRQARRSAVPQQPKPSGNTPPRPAAAPALQVKDRSAIVADMMSSRNKPRGRVGIN